MGPSLREVAEALLPTYRSIDLRAVVVALGDGQGWRNVVTVVRLSETTPQEVKTSHEALISDLRLPSQFMNTQLGRQHAANPYVGFNVDLASYPASSFWSLADDIARGRIKTPSRVIRLIDADSIPLDNTDPALIRPEQSGRSHWVYHWRWGQKTGEFTGAVLSDGTRAALTGPELDRRSRAAGLENFRALTEEIVGIPWYASDALEVYLPVYATLTNVEQSPTTMGVTGSAPRSLFPVVVEAKMTSYENSARRRYGASKRVTIHAPEGDEPEVPFSAEFDMPDRPAVGQLEVSLFKREPTRVEMGDLRVDLSSRALLFNVYSQFVPEADITEYLGVLVRGTGRNLSRLYQNFKSHNRQKKAEELLEHLMTHLMALCELNPLSLADSQHDVVSGELSAGSADLVGLAAAGRPLLVSCTMGMPDEKKRGMLRSARTAVARRCGIEESAFVLVLVTGKPTSRPVSDDVHDVAASDLERVWKAIKRGDIAEGRRILGVQQAGPI